MEPGLVVEDVEGLAVVFQEVVCMVPIHFDLLQPREDLATAIEVPALVSRWRSFHRLLEFGSWEVLVGLGEVQPLGDEEGPSSRQEEHLPCLLNKLGEVVVWGGQLVLALELASQSLKLKRADPYRFHSMVDSFSSLIPDQKAFKSKRHSKIPGG
jgi:hypothetical protein